MNLPVTVRASVPMLSKSVELRTNSEASSIRESRDKRRRDNSDDIAAEKEPNERKDQEVIKGA